MGTNYYWTDDAHPCPTCGHEKKTEVHIGKNSFGWDFMFHGPDGIRSWDDWKKKLASGGRIYNEYGETLTLEEFTAIVENRSADNMNHVDYCKKHHPDELKRLWKDDRGFCFSHSEFS